MHAASLIDVTLTHLQQCSNNHTVHKSPATRTNNISVSFYFFNYVLLTIPPSSLTLVVCTWAHTHLKFKSCSRTTHVTWISHIHIHPYHHYYLNTTPIHHHHHNTTSRCKSYRKWLLPPLTQSHDDGVHPTTTTVQTMTTTIFVTTTPCKSHHHGLPPPLTQSGTLQCSDKDDEVASTTTMTMMTMSHTRQHNTDNDKSHMANATVTQHRQRGQWDGHRITRMRQPQYHHNMATAWWRRWATPGQCHGDTTPTMTRWWPHWHNNDNNKSN